MRMTPLIVASLLSGCVVYDNDCPRDGSDVGYDDDYNTDYGEDEAPEPVYSLTPDTAAPGDVFIGSLISDQAVDFEAIVEVEFLSEDVQICTTQAREDELLLTIGVSEWAVGGEVDALITFDSGERTYVEALLVVTDGSGDGSSDGSGDSGSDGSSGDGSSGDGSTGSTDGESGSSVCG